MCFIKTPPSQVEEPSISNNVSPITIILGTAHLSSTPGKRSPDGTFREYQYSREICNLVCNELRSRGYKCIIDYIADDMPGLTSSQELIKRVGIVNNLYDQLDKQVIYISIHVNAAAGNNEWKKATGWSIYTSKGLTKSDKLAECIYERAKLILEPLGKKLRTDFSDNDPDFEENFYVLKHTKCPAVLTENFFQDCKTDVDWLLTDKAKQTLTNIHVEGIIDYLKTLS